MTKQRDLKKQVRARAAKTGETYTTARSKLLEDRTKYVRHCIGCNVVLPDGPEAEKHVCPCDTSYGKCVLKKGHPDDHLDPDGNLWNVGKMMDPPIAGGLVYPKDALEVPYKRADGSTVFFDKVVPSAPKPGVDPWNTKNAAQEALMDAARADVRETLASEPVRSPLPKASEVMAFGSATQRITQAIEAWGITIGPGGKLVASDGRELKARWSPESAADIAHDLKAFHGIDGEVELARAVLDAVFTSLMGQDSMLDHEPPPPPEPEPQVLWHGQGQAVMSPDKFERELMESAKGMLPALAKLNPPPPDAPTPAQLARVREPSEPPVHAFSSNEPDCTCGVNLGADARCPFHHPPVVPVDIGSVALPTPGDVSIQSRDGRNGTTDYWLTRGGQDVYRLGFRDRAGNTVLATDATCTCGRPSLPGRDCEFHHPKPQGVDVAERLVQQAIADHATGVRGVVTVDTGNLTPEEATQVLIATKARYRTVLRLPPLDSKGRCSKCGDLPGPGVENCACAAAEGEAPQCSMRSSATNQRCTLADGHPAYTPTRFHCFTKTDDIGLCVQCRRRPEHQPIEGERTCTCESIPPGGRIFHGDGNEALDPETVAVRAARETTLQKLPPVPVADLVPMLEALKYINGGDAHPDEARAEAREVLDEFDAKHPEVLTALHEPDDEEDEGEPTPEELAIIVNGRAVNVRARALDYRAVVALAGYDPERLLSVTYRAKSGNWKREGVLSPGQSVEALPGMVFNVADTSGA